MTLLRRRREDDARRQPGANWNRTGVDPASARDFGPGSIVLMPANWVHVSGCRAGSECVFYQEGKGRFDFKPVAAKAP